MNNHLWLITAETNLHVGNENDSSYGIIDKAIQRDPLTSLPCINSSSLKGAINEYFTNFKELAPETRIRIFGSDKADRNGKDKKQQKGEVIFFDAHLLFLPVQDDSNLYHYETSGKVMDLFLQRLKMLGIGLDGFPKNNFNQYQDFFHLGRDVRKNNNFVVACSDENLPIIARNCLDNGVSANLWYEQILPSKTVLYFFTSGDVEKDVFSKNLDKSLVQIGANATIGYGYCSITKVV